MSKPRHAFVTAMLVSAHAAAGTPAEPAAERDSVGLTVGGLVQADAILSNQRSQDELDGSTGGPLNQTRFLIRRARVRLDLERGFVWGGLELDMNTIDGVRGSLTEADIGAVWRGRVAEQDTLARATLGLFRIPFGWEVAQRDRDRFFLERTTMSRALFPGTYDIGARAEAAYGPLKVAVAVMNGNPLGDTLLPARDPNAAKDVMGRLGVETRRSAALGLRMGVSVLDGTGFHPGTPSTKDRLVWHDTNENSRVDVSELEVLAGVAASPSQNFGRFALGSDIEVRVAVPVLGALSVSGELMWAKNLDRGLQPADPIASGRDLREAGYYIGVTQEITRYFQIGFRYDRYNPDLDGAEQRGVKLVPVDGSYSTRAFAIAFRYTPGRLILEYDDNENALGRTPSGLPTTLASNQLALRGEVVF